MKKMFTLQTKSDNIISEGRYNYFRDRVPRYCQRFLLIQLYQTAPGSATCSPDPEGENMKAFVYGSEVQILHFYIAKRGTPYCMVRVLESGWVQKVPTSCVEIR